VSAAQSGSALTADGRVSDRYTFVMPQQFAAWGFAATLEGP
jgi:hypothetical protein